MRHDLLELLSRLYPTPREARAVIGQLLRIEYINVEGPGILVWAGILEEAHKAKRLDALVFRVLQERPQLQEELMKALFWYEREQPTEVDRFPGDTVPAGVPGGTPSPFQTRGPLEHDAESYVKRRCDETLERAAASLSFIWLQGDFQHGKTSLINRYRSWLSAEWTAIPVTPEEIDCTTVRRFTQGFFASVNDAIGLECDWKTLFRLLQERKLAFLIDEFAKCGRSSIGDLLERLYSLAERAPRNLRLVVTVGESPASLLANCGLANPKYRNCWQVIHLDAFTTAEVAGLIAFFPDHLAVVLREHMAYIEKKTSFRPQDVQEHLDEAWKMFIAFDGDEQQAASALADWMTRAKRDG